MPKKRKVPRTLQRHFLREWRQFRGLSQEAAASRLELDRTTLSKIERGKVPYDQRLLEIAAEAYNCSPADLVMRDPSQANAMWSIWENLRAAPAEDQRRVQAVVEAMLKTG